MPNTKSALKAARVSERHRVRNKPIRAGVKTRVRRAETEITTGNAEAAAPLVTQAVSALDKAAAKGIIHPNNAARRKSRLMRKLNQAAAQPAPAPTQPKPTKARATARATKRAPKPAASK